MRTALTTTAAAALALALLTGCGGQSGKHDCASVADAVNGNVKDLRAAVAKGTGNPRDAATALRKLQLNLDQLTSGGNSATTKAVADLSLAASNAKNALDKGEPVDLRPINAAAGALTSSCGKG
ncbi:hypothetical protein ACFOSC_16335 [Streptantibioticus rubrisoli]|uniref:Secreted protein n=1 Tax=Streptantibioticus rubrisoli TaxID=1387313 RepID=A0ABT1PDZ9_9ACTN|nr:hypothetical protein [Streptantibioticus rubrisoli]MCQ4042463.1 hypothetical protein [Streptantibioticus rubrisoli]